MTRFCSRAAIKAGLFVFCLTMPIVFAACRQKSSTIQERKIFVGVFERQLNPVDYRDYLIGHWADYVAYTGSEFSTFKDKPANVNQNLAWTNIEWGNYAEAQFYAKRALEIRHADDNMNVYALATLLAGGAGASALLQGHDPVIVRDFSTFYPYYELATSIGDVAEKCRLLRNMLSVIGYEAKDFLFLFLRHEQYSPSADELNMVAEEVVAYFDRIGVRIQKNGSDEIMVSYSVKLDLGGTDSYYLGLCGLCLSDFYTKQGNIGLAEAWQKRAALAMEFAAKSMNFRPSMRHRFDQVAASLKTATNSAPPPSK